MSDALTLDVFALQHNPWRARMHTAAATVTATGVVTTVAYDTLDYDPAAMCTTGATAKITVQVAGLYHLAAGGVFTNNASGQVYMVFNKNGVTYGDASQMGGGASAFSPGLTLNDYAAANAGDYFSVVVDQASGGNVNFTGHFCVTYIGPT